MRKEVVEKVKVPIFRPAEVKCDLFDTNPIVRIQRNTTEHNEIASLGSVRQPKQVDTAFSHFEKKHLIFGAPRSHPLYHSAFIMTVVQRINDAVRDSFIGRYFEMEKRNATFFGEWRGATATFMSMAYILAVNPRILADSGGPCDVTADDFEECLTQVRREYVTATALGSIAGTLLMGIMANLPVALAPGVRACSSCCMFLILRCSHSSASDGVVDASC
jgi:hypothetical protein